MTTSPNRLPEDHRAEAAPAAQGRAVPSATAVFDVCHVGVVLRSLVLVHAVLGLGVAFSAADLATWLTLTASASAVALPGVLLWLLSACLLKRAFARWPVAGQGFAAALLGAACGIFGWLLASASGLGLFDASRWLAPAAAGAGFAAMVFQWLQWRSQAWAPAEAAARLAELQSRIRPHFLFNTLNTALGLVRLDPARAEEVLEDLAELFRVALADDDAPEATLADEVDLARRYLAIEQIRFGERLVVTWELDAEAGAARLPPLLLQPLVENAVRHGVEPAEHGGHVHVRTRLARGQVEIDIVNGVCGNPSRPGSGMALRNVRERLGLMHDVASHFEARRDGDEFRVRIVVPL